MNKFIKIILILVLLQVLTVKSDFLIVDGGSSKTEVFVLSTDLATLTTCGENGNDEGKFATFLKNPENITTTPKLVTKYDSYIGVIKTLLNGTACKSKAASITKIFVFSTAGSRDWISNTATKPADNKINFYTDVTDKLKTEIAKGGALISTVTNADDVVVSVVNGVWEGIYGFVGFRLKLDDATNYATKICGTTAAAAAAAVPDCLKKIVYTE